ncbi:hypothetical protein ACSNOI_30415 [Actinomadura kijaniata]
MRSPFAENVAVPRTLVELLADDVPQEARDGRRRRPRKVRVLRHSA